MQLVLLIILSFFALNVSAKEAVQEPSKLTLQRSLKTDSYETLEFQRVVDGDTIVASGRKIRLWGIDAPERGEALFEVSSKGLELFISDQSLTCKFIELDRYQRDVMHCLVNGKDIGALMIKVGFAKDYSKYSGGFYKPEERFAKKAKLGVWK